MSDSSTTPAVRSPEPARFAMLPVPVLMHPDLSATAVRLYAYLALRADAQGRVKVEVNELATAIHCHRETVGIARGELVEVGALLVDIKARPGVYNLGFCGIRRDSRMSENPTRMSENPTHIEDVKPSLDLSRARARQKHAQSVAPSTSPKLTSMPVPLTAEPCPNPAEVVRLALASLAKEREAQRADKEPPAGDE